MIEVFFFLLKLLGLTAAVVICSLYLAWVERKIIGWIQFRHGPVYVGKKGLLQPVADCIKLFSKSSGGVGYSRFLYDDVQIRG